MNYLADDGAAIRARLREIRLAEGRGDDDYVTAQGKDLDALAAREGLVRLYAETDAALRQRIASALGAD
jgi:hypothetical protein